MNFLSRPPFGFLQYTGKIRFNLTDYDFFKAKAIMSTEKKTTYALKTPHVVALPFIYGVESLLVTDDEDLQSATEATSLVVMPSYTLLGI